MNGVRKYGKYAALAVALLVATQAGVSFLVKTHRMRGYLIAHLESAFGRPVQAGEFSVQILPIPQLDVDGVTIGEDPAFGHEYFLRAERLGASFRWLGLLRGHFEFGNMSLTRPSLILVRNAQGRWNLEGWLPPARPNGPDGSKVYGPQRPVESTHHLQKIEFDDGRINFKQGDEKRPFAFTNVSGSVEQVAPGRWQLRVEAQPWRSGVALQSTGTLQVRGDLAGTSARLQPAQIQLHWDKASLADLFRLATGNDPGVRGDFALDGNASIAKAPTGEAGGSGASQWKFELQARTTQVHRWDLTERSDNPRVNLNLKGIWDLTAGEARAEELSIHLPHSSLHGSAWLETTGAAAWSVKVESAAVQGQDLLAWYRAFHPDVSEGLAVEQFFSGSFAVRGWPLKWEGGRISSQGGTLRVPGFEEPVKIGSFGGKLENEMLSVERVRLSLSAARQALAATTRPGKTSAKTRPLVELQNAAELRLVHDFSAGKTSLYVDARLEHAENFFKLASSFGHVLNHGWELSGGVSTKIEWDSGRVQQKGQWTGALDLTKAQLQAAGLNLPLKLDEARLEWKEGRRSATIARAQAFGAIWSGTITETASGNPAEENNWGFQLHADHLDATELDRWFGPRARPNWVQRLLPSLLGTSQTGAKASELLRRVSAEGELSADTLAIEEIKLAKGHAKVLLRNLHLEVREAEAQWAGGTVHGGLEADLSPSPKYEISAEINRVSLVELPWPTHWAERWSGTATGQVHLRTGGVGRDELLRQLAGNGEILLQTTEFKGWDVGASADSGTVHTGASRWASGRGKFAVKDRAVSLDALELTAPKGKTRLTGTLSFAQEGKLTFTPVSAEKRGPKAIPAARAFQVSGPLDSPVATVVGANTRPAKP